MDKQVQTIYDLLYSPIVTPLNLVENAKLNNYSYVSFYKSNDGIIAEMKCTMDDYQEAIFFYHFDQEDKLNFVYMETANKRKELVFDRIKELEEAKNKFLAKTKKLPTAI